MISEQPAELVLGLRAAGGEVAALRAAIRRCARAMAETGMERIGVADALVGLLRHEDSRVRQEVAETLDLLPEPFFGHAYEALAKDENQLVRAAADRASRRRAVETKARAKRDAKGRELREALEALGERFGEGARRLGEHVAALASADKAAEARHELARAIDAAGAPLGEIERELGKPAPGPGTLAMHAKALRDRHEHLGRVLDRALGATGGGRPVLKREALRVLVEKAREHVGAVTGRDVEIAVDVAKDLALDADAPSLRQAIENALKNAVEAQRGRPGAVRVSARALRKGAVIELEIEDSGVGMDEDEVARSLVPFSSKKEGGTGVGMPTVRRVVEDIHRGELQVSSRKGEGTRLVMRLPGKKASRARGAMR